MSTEIKHTAKDNGKAANKGAEGVERKSGELETSETKKQRTDAKGRDSSEKKSVVEPRATSRIGTTNPPFGGAPSSPFKLAESKATTKKSPASKTKTDKKDEDKAKTESEKSRLTTLDIEFEYDRSQLPDPRGTPGRVRKPCYHEFDIPAELREEISQKFHLPKPEKPKGRLNWKQEDDLVRQEGLMNPLHCFHAEYKTKKAGVAHRRTILLDSCWIETNV